MAPRHPEHSGELQVLHDQCLALLDLLAEQSQGKFLPDRWRNILTTLYTRQDLRGIRRAARELREAIVPLEPAERFALLQGIRRRTGGSLRRLDKRDRHLAAKIFSRGRIRDEKEYYTVRIYLDALEEDPDKAGKAAKVRALLAGYHAEEQA